MEKSVIKRNFTLVVFLIVCTPLYAWENRYTHPAITDEAVNLSGLDNFLKIQLGKDDGFLNELYWDFPSDISERINKGGANQNQQIRTILEWIKMGSNIEDMDGRSIPWRPRHHFYDPTCNFQDLGEPGRSAGLDNHTDYPDWDAPGWSTWLPLGQSALVWAITGQASYDPRNNHDKWGTARTIFYQALTEQSKATREARLAESLVKLGCVAHLLEDMGVPAHTRNDFLFAHYRNAYFLDWGEFLEGKVENQIKSNSGQSLWSGSNPVAFNKLSKYFDTDVYSGGYLNGQPPPAGTWDYRNAQTINFYLTAQSSDAQVQNISFRTQRRQIWRHSLCRKVSNYISTALTTVYRAWHASLTRITK